VAVSCKNKKQTKIICKKIKKALEMQRCNTSEMQQPSYKSKSFGLVL
jgi:hypothetical protein